MTLERLEVRNFQSVHQADVQLGKLTVIVGPSNSGKSALLRALRTLARNAATPSFVTSGKKSSVIRLGLEDGVMVTLERGKALSTYQISRPAPEDEQGDFSEVAQFAKSGTAVPDEVRSLLALAEVEDELVNFAFQFDPPFLLDESATKVAKVLGDLTNINVIYDAVREANRRRLDVTAKLKVRREDVERLRGRLQEFSDVPERKRVLEEARQEFDAAKEEQEQAQYLDGLLTTSRIAAQAIAALEAMDIPDESSEIAEIEDSLKTVAQLQSLLQTLKTSAALARDLKEDIASLSHEIAMKDDEYHDMLVAGGTCPMCGREIDA